MNLSIIQEHIPSLQKASNVTKVLKGFSSDFKYFAYVASDIPTHVIRTAPLQQIDRKKREFEIVGRVHGIGVKTSEAIEFGSIESLDICYMVLRYVQGEDASDVLPTLTREEQYSIGTEAGRELRLMHELEAPADLDTWYILRTAKHNRQFNDYRNCGFKLPEEDMIVSFIRDNLKHMSNRPNRFQHDDFHPSNILMQSNSYVGTIDFNRYDWGDPFHDFFKIAYFSREISIPFSIGQIDGYFDGLIPEQFWKLYALYTAMNIFGTITWTLQVIPEQLESMLARIQTVLEDHQNFETVVPVWFKP